jgi:hypothetical protein
VSARHLLAIFDCIYVASLAAWLGSTLFLTFVTLPVVFQVLGQPTNHKVVRALYARYYFWGVIWGSIALPSFVSVPLCFPEFRGPLVGIQAIAILGCILIMLYGGNTVAQGIGQFQDDGLRGDERSRRIHERCLRVNVVLLCVALALLLAYAIRGSPKTAGIVELSPAERAAREAAATRAIAGADGESESPPETR